MSRAFGAQVRQQGHSVVIDLHGEIDGQAETELTQAYQRALAGKPRRIVLNFAAVDYINSTGLALIVGLLAQARQARLPLHIYGLSEHYQQIFQITRLADFMQIFPDEASALQGIPGGNDGKTDHPGAESKS
jgi:anti-anti-sigma factor